MTIFTPQNLPINMNHFYSKSALLFGLCLAVILPLKAQITTDSEITVSDLINDVMLGDGVNAFNITYNGLPGDTTTVQVGYFDAQGSNFPIQEGLVMATANVEIIHGGLTNQPDNFQNDPDLMALSGQNMNNCAIIEFDFTVDSDSVIFDYIFASAEYNSFTCTNFNDVFGFFLSGPGISGPFSDDAINIALIPGTDTPVGVNTVNGGAPTGSGSFQNCFDANPNFVEDSQYFIDNNNVPNSISSTLNGHTVTLTARSPITCGETYHIKLAIGNAVDQGFQSAVFLRKGSFTAAGEVFVDVTPTLPGVNLEGTGFENVVVAGCFSPLVELTRPEGAPVGSITVSYGGTAVENVDYVLGENDTLFAFSDGVDTLQFNITTFPNPNAADTIFLDFFVIFETCFGLDTAIASIPIIQPYSISSATEDVVVTCPADSVIVIAEGLDGVGPYIFIWEGADTTAGATWVPVPPDQQYYYVELLDQCEFEVILDSVLVTNNIPPPLSLSLPELATPLCPGMPVEIVAQVSDGNVADSSEYIFAWNPALSVSEVLQVAFVQSQTVFLTVTDTCGTQVSDSVLVTYPEYEDLEISMELDKRICPENPLFFKVTAEGGAGEYSYRWIELEGNGFFSDNDAAETFFEPLPGFSFIEVEVFDQCAQLGFSNSSVYLAEDTRMDSLRNIDLEKVPNVLTTNGDQRNERFAVPGLDIFPGTRLEIFDRWGTQIFESDDYRVGTPGGIGEPAPAFAFDGNDHPDGTYFIVLNVNSGECVKAGNLNIVGSNIPRRQRGIGR